MKPLEIVLVDDGHDVVGYYLTLDNLTDVLQSVGVIAHDRLNHPSRNTSEPPLRWRLGPDLEPYNGPGDGLDSSRSIRVETTPDPSSAPQTKEET